MLNRSRKIATTASVALILGLTLTSCSNNQPSPEPLPAPTDPSASASAKPPTALDPADQIPEEIVANDADFGHYVSNELLVSVKDGVSMRKALETVSENEKTFLAGEDQKTGEFKVVFEKNFTLEELQEVRETWVAETDLFRDVRLNSWY